MLKYCVIILLLMCGCKSTPRLEDIPLKSGDQPYCLPPGEYTDVEGVTHKEIYNRWSMSEEDVYDFVKSITPKPKSKTK